MKLEGDLIVSNDVTVSGSGAFTDGLTVSGVPVPLSGTSFVGFREVGNVFFAQTVTGSVTLVQRADYPFRIREMTAQTVSGTVSGTLRINSTIVQGIANRVWNTTAVTSTATSGNTVSAGDKVTLSISGTSNFLRFAATYVTERL